MNKKRPETTMEDKTIGDETRQYKRIQVRVRVRVRVRVGLGLGLGLG